MPNQIYLVHWSSYIPAHSEKDAVLQALAIQRENSSKLIFDVDAPQGNRTTIDLSDGGPAKEEVQQARQALIEVGQLLPAELIDGVKEYFNCREAKIDGTGNVWIAYPQFGHLIGDGDIIALVEWLRTRAE
jgi:hypothetical protein